MLWVPILSFRHSEYQHAVHSTLISCYRTKLSSLFLLSYDPSSPELNADNYIYLFIHLYTWILFASKQYWKNKMRQFIENHIKLQFNLMNSVSMLVKSLYLCLILNTYSFYFAFLHFVISSCYLDENSWCSLPSTMTVATACAVGDARAE